MYCSNCGIEFTGNQNFCNKCGQPVQNIYTSNFYKQNAYDIRPYTPEIMKPVRATGFLQVWLYIITIINIGLFFYYIVNAIMYSYAAFYYVFAALYATGLVIGAIFLLLGHKIGYYVICAFVFVNIVFNLAVFYKLSPSVAGSIIFPGLLWLALKKQWYNFR